jgi:hypothetical protein
MTSKFLLAASAVLAIAGIDARTASADVIYTGVISSQPAANYSGGLTITVPQFDTTLGSLSGVLITVATTEAAAVQVSNTSPTDYTFTNGNAAVTLFTSGPGGFATLLTTTSTVASGVALANSVSTFPGLTSANTTAAISIPSGNFTSYEGVGPANLTFDALVTGTNFSGSSAAPGSTLFFGGSANLGVTVTVDYEYAPEPASIALIGTAMVGFGAIRRRHRAV